MLEKISDLKDNLIEKAHKAVDHMPIPVRETLKVRAFTLFRIPLIAFLGPKILRTDDQEIGILIPLGYRSKNHVNSMYFAALAAGADLAVGLLATRHIEKSGKRVQLVFKDFHADFLKRAESDVTFSCNEGEAIAALVEKAIESGERQNQAFKASAHVAGENEPVATFTLTLSLKVKG